MVDQKLEPESYTVFVSHASDDRGRAEALAQQLEATGHRCWIAPRDVRPGHEYGEEIVRGIENSKCVVLLLSGPANDSTFVRREIERAVSKGKPIFPLRLTDVSPSAALELFISSVQWIDAFDEDWERHAARLTALLDGGLSINHASRPSAWWGTWAKRTGRVLAYSFVGLFLLTADFLGFNDATQRYSEAAFYNVISPRYGETRISGLITKPKDAGEKPWRWNQNISVILLDDDALKSGDKSGVRPPDGISWPAPLKYHVKLLTDLYETYHPAAIMIDILFLDRRAGDGDALKALVRLIEKIKKEGRSRLFLAASNPARERTQILSELANAADLVAISWPEKDENNPLFYPLSEGAGIDQPDNSADNQGDTSANASGASFAIYRHLCNSAGGAKIRAAMSCPDAELFDKHFILPMQVFWGAIAPTLNWEQANLGIECTAQTRSVPRRVWNLLMKSIAETPDAVRQTCPYAQMLKARDFMDPEFRQDVDVKPVLKRAFGQSPDELPKIVFYGASFRGAADQVRTPTHGKIAGVFMHAMALDNLLTLGKGYIREAKQFEPVLLLLNWLMALLVAVIAVLGRDLQIFLLGRGKSWLWTTSIVAGSFLASMLVIGLAMYISFVGLRLAPLNWLGFFSIMGMIWMVQTRRVENAIFQIFSRVRRKSPATSM